jgi:hypothetical protein
VIRRSSSSATNCGSGSQNDALEALLPERRSKGDFGAVELETPRGASSRSLSAIGHGVERSCAIAVRSLAPPASSHKSGPLVSRNVPPIGRLGDGTTNNRLSVWVDARQIGPLVSVASITGERKTRRIGGAAMLFRHDMFHVEGNEGRRGLRQPAILTGVPGPAANQIASPLVQI